jgi:hypothetical protein
VFVADPGTRVVHYENGAELTRYADPIATGRPAIPYPATHATIEVSYATNTPTWQQLGLQVTGPDGPWCQLAGIMIGLVMLHSHRFGRAIPSTLIVGNVVGFGLYLPSVGVAISAFSGLVLRAWYLLIARKSLRLAGPMAQVPGPSAT